jgi:Tol biopolymer transport system component/DNA-binding winged helix-turn-helix (wHTH) protein
MRVVILRVGREGLRLCDSGGKRFLMLIRTYMTPMLVFGEYRFDPANGILSRGGEELPLPPRAVAVLSRLLRDPGTVVSKQELLDSVWDGAYVTETSLSEAVGLLRQALRDPAHEPSYIQTVHRRGYRFIAEVREENGRAPRETTFAPPPAPAPPRQQARRKRPWRMAAAAVAAGSLAGLLSCVLLVSNPRRPRTPGPPPISRFTIVPPGARELLITIPSIAVSPDGRHIVYVARRGDESALFHRDVSSFASREIAGTRGGAAPFFSPDGRRVGFVLDRRIVAVPLAGGTPLTLAASDGTLTGASWNDDDSIVFAAGLPTSLFRARPGGTIEKLTGKELSHGGGHFWPRTLPGGKAVLFTTWKTTMWDARVEWLSLVTGARHTVMTRASHCQFAKGLLVCARTGGTIVAAPFDPDSGRVTGPALPLVQDVATGSFGLAQMAVGGDTLIYLAAAEQGERTLKRLVDGKAAPLPMPARMYRNVKEGPAGQLAVTVLDQDRSDVWLIDSANNRTSRLTFSGFNIEPVWSPDGQWVAFASDENGAFNVYRRRADGSAAAELLVRTAHAQIPVAWSPDGRELMVADTDPATYADLWVLDLATRNMRPWLRTPEKELMAAWSPDGKWVAYMSSETEGRWEVHVRSYRNGSGRWQISPDGGLLPSWSADGRTIYFLRRTQVQRELELWAVPVNPNGAELQPGRARRVFHDEAMVLATAGRRGVLLIAETSPPRPAAELRVMRDWAPALPAR